MQNLGQLGPKNCVIVLIACSNFAPKSIHQIAQFQFQKFKIFQFLRGTIPPQTPPSARKCVIGSSHHRIITHTHTNVEDGSTPLAKNNSPRWSQAYTDSTTTRTVVHLLKLASIVTNV